MNHLSTWLIAVAALILWSTVSVVSQMPAPPAALFIMDVAQRVGFR
jgi:hypothetical protein